MSEIKEGEYIRTKQGYIAKVEDIEGNIIMCDSDIYSYYEVAPILVGEQMKLITKHSFNIIDLIEVGDFVNGVEVVETANNKFIDEKLLKNTDIKSIVTKEQFNSVMYKVGDIE